MTKPTPEQMAEVERMLAELNADTKECVAKCGRRVPVSGYECSWCQDERRGRTGGSMGLKPGTMAYARSRRARL